MLSVYPLVTETRATALWLGDLVGSHPVAAAASLAADDGAQDLARLHRSLIRIHQNLRRFPVLYYCTLCLASAVISVTMTAPAMDEVLASLQHLRRVRLAGGSVWRAVLGRGGPQPDEPLAAGGVPARGRR